MLQVHGEFRKILEPIRVTPLQAGVMLYLSRHADAKLTDASTTLGMRLPTLSVVVETLVRKRWVTKHRSLTDTRVVHLFLSQRGEALAQRIKKQVRGVRSDLTQMKEASS